MCALLMVPNTKLVEDACEQFDRENGIVEAALGELFAKYPANDNESHILLKVVALNSLYSTRILAVLKMARHIYGLAERLDAALSAGLPEAVDWIAAIGIEDKNFHFCSFASKYCNWHRPALYPIYDSRVDKYLWHLKKQGLFDSELFTKHADLWDYPAFQKIMLTFRNEFGLVAFSFKQIDKFLWSQGEFIWQTAAENRFEDLSDESGEPVSDSGSNSSEAGNTFDDGPAQEAVTALASGDGIASNEGGN